MEKISWQIAFQVILTGIFTLVVFIAMNPTGLDASFYIIFVLLFIFIFFYGLSVGQKLAMPVKKLLKRAIDLSKGDLKTRFYLETKDEFGELAQIFNKIADELEESRNTTANSEKSIDIKVKAKTQDLQETINALEQKVKNRTIELERLLQESQKLQDSAKSKESETQDLKDEINNIKSKLPKRKIKNIEDENLEDIEDLSDDSEEA